MTNVKDISDTKILNLIEISYLFGEKIFSFGFKRFIEIGCGFAIPSITISKLGGSIVKAFDIDMKLLDYPKKIIKKYNINTDIECKNFNYTDINVEDGDVWIAEKPRSCNSFENFELNILNRAIEKNVNIAIVPTVKSNNSRLLIKNYILECKNIELKLKKSGYELESDEITKGFPIRWIIGIKNKKSKKG